MLIKTIDNFITEEDANILINEIKSPSEVNPYPDYYKNRNGGTAFPYNNSVMFILKKYAKLANKVQKEFFNLDTDVIITKSFGSGWTPGTSGNPHIDAIEKEPFIEYSTVIYLNDDYEGGEIYFPKQGFSQKAKKYSALFFPGNDYQYIHGVKEITSGNRYTALYMQSTKKEFIDPDFEGC
jgi:hypothetical protein